jgi:hypothetical protein
MPRKKNYAPWDSPYYRQMNRGVDKMFGKGPKDPDKSHWIIIAIVFVVLGLIIAALKHK